MIYFVLFREARDSSAEMMKGTRKLNLARTLELDSNNHGCSSQNKDESVSWLQDAGSYATTVSIF